jgi:hypothetical protein
MQLMTNWIREMLCTIQLYFHIVMKNVVSRVAQSDYGLYDQAIEVRFPADAKGFFL